MKLVKPQFCPALRFILLFACIHTHTHPCLSIYVKTHVDIMLPLSPNPNHNKIHNPNLDPNLVSMCSICCLHSLLAVSRKVCGTDCIYCSHIHSTKLNILKCFVWLRQIGPMTNRMWGGWGGCLTLNYTFKCCSLHNLELSMNIVSLLMILTCHRGCNEQTGQFLA